MQTSRTRRRSLTPAVILLLAALGCGGRETSLKTVRMEVRTVWQQPTEAEDPLLIFPRDILRLRDRVYVLDGRLAHVAVFDAGTGEPVGAAFGGLGQGPGEMGLFPYALVSDGERLGVANLFQVSWFTPEGKFLARDPLPVLDLGTPSLQFAGGGWLYGAGYQGPDSPLAVWITPEKDTLDLGSAEAPPEGVSDAVAGQWNAVHAVRLPDGVILLGHEMQNRIDILDPAGTPRGSERWTHLPTDPERTPTGRPVGLPGFTFAARLGSDGHAYLTDGTLRRVRVYGAGGGLLREIELDDPVFTAAWGTPGVIYAIDGNDRLLGIHATPDPSAGDSGEEEGTTGQQDATLPGRLETIIPDLPGFFDRHLILRTRRPTRPGDPPTIPTIRSGVAGLYLGYDDGQGIFSPRGTDGLEQALRSSPPPVESRSPDVVIGSDGPWLLTRSSGLFPLDQSEDPIRWSASDAQFSGALQMEDGDWLLHSLQEGSEEPLLLFSPDAGMRPAGAHGRHGASDPRWAPAWNAWHLLPWTDGAAVFDESRVRIAYWGEEGLGDWRPVTGTPLRPIEERSRSVIPDFDMDGVVSSPGRAFVVWKGDFVRGEVINDIWIIAPDGQMTAHHRLPMPNMLSGIALDPDGSLLLLTRYALYRWSGWEPIP